LAVYSSGTQVLFIRNLAGVSAPLSHLPARDERWSVPLASFVFRLLDALRVQVRGLFEQLRDHRVKRFRGLQRRP
jgi:hypothetical protein